MSKFTDFIDSIKDDAGKLAKDELKELISSAKKSESLFIKLQAKNVERLTLTLAEGNITVFGYKRLIKKLEILNSLEEIKLTVKTKAAAQRFATGLNELVIKGLFKLI